jgi:hypothetical protein
MKKEQWKNRRQNSGIRSQNSEYSMEYAECSRQTPSARS